MAANSDSLVKQPGADMRHRAVQLVHFGYGRVNMNNSVIYNEADVSSAPPPFM
jgi:hypothetical protein